MSAMYVVRVVRRAWNALYRRIQPLDAAGKAQLQREVEFVRRLQHVAAAQRTNNVRASNYKARCGFGPTVLQPNEDAGGTADATDRRIISFDRALQRVRDGTAAARGRAAQQTLDVSFTRDKFVFVPGDIIFVLAGDIEDEDNPHAFVDATEPWWALQVTRPFERARMRPRCQVHGYWLGRAARSSATRWVLLQGMEVRIYYGSVLITERAQPLLISSSELATG